MIRSRCRVAVALEGPSGEHWGCRGNANRRDTSTPTHVAKARAGHVEQMYVARFLTAHERRLRPALVIAATALGLGIGIGAAVWSAGSTSAAVGRPATSVDVPAGPEKLFVVDGTAGWATRLSPDTWRVTIVSRSLVTWFADRPVRASGAASARSLVRRWSTLFTGSPPFGALLAPDGPRGHHPTSVEVTAPSYDASSGSVSFRLTPDGDESREDTAWLSRMTRARSARDGRVILFLDGSTPSGVAPPPPGPQPAALAAAYAEAQDAIAVLRRVAAGSTEQAAVAQADLAAIAHAAEPTGAGS